MVITGRIFDIVHVSDKSAQIVIRKKLGDKIVPVAIEVYGFWRDKAINEQKLKPKDKIKANVYLKSRIWNNKYITDVFFKHIVKVEEYTDGIQLAHNSLFKTEDGMVDGETGEVIE